MTKPSKEYFEKIIKKISDYMVITRVEEGSDHWFIVVVGKDGIPIPDTPPYAIDKKTGDVSYLPGIPSSVLGEDITPLEKEYHEALGNTYLTW